MLLTCLLAALYLHVKSVSFDVVAINKTVNAPVTADHACSRYKVDLSKLNNSNTRSNANTNNDSTSTNSTSNNNRSNIDNANCLRVAPKKPNGRIQQLSRITVVLSDDKHQRSLDIAAHVLQGYDLVALRPTNESTFRYACQDADIDIISLDLSERLSFQLKYKIVGVALSRGISFEIDIAPAFRDVTARRNLMANALMLSRVVKGHNIIVTCSANTSIELRGPYDIINLGQFFGLRTANARAAIVATARRCVMHGVSRRTSRGLVSLQELNDENLWMAPIVDSRQTSSSTTTTTTATNAKQIELIDEPIVEDDNNDDIDNDNVGNDDNDNNNDSALNLNTIADNDNNDVGVGVVDNDDDVDDKVAVVAKQKKAKLGSSSTEPNDNKNKRKPS